MNAKLRPPPAASLAQCFRGRFSHLISLSRNCLFRFLWTLSPICGGLARGFWKPLVVFVKLPHPRNASCYGCGIRRPRLTFECGRPAGAQKGACRKGWTQSTWRSSSSSLGGDTRPGVCQRVGEPAPPGARPRNLRSWQDPQPQARGVFPRQLQAEIKRLWPSYRAKLSRASFPP